MSDIINNIGKKIIKVETEFFNKKLSLEINRVGFRTSASVLARYGDTVVLASVMIGNDPAKEIDYFPLSIDYEEKMYASGKISGSRFIKREGRPSDEAILIGRLIDRPIRPLWPKDYHNEVQGVATVLSMDPSFRPDMIAMIALSSAFLISGAPFKGPVAGLRVSKTSDGFTAFDDPENIAKSGLDLVVAANDDGVMMVEAGANEISESEMVEAINYAVNSLKPALEIQHQLKEKAGITDISYESVAIDPNIMKITEGWLDGKMGINLQKPYPERNNLIKQLKEDFMQFLLKRLGEDDFDILRKDYLEAFEKNIHLDVRRHILEKGIRPDGRTSEEIRPLGSEVGLLPRVHGSSLFTRGLTQALNTVTLAPLSFSQIVDTMEKDEERRFFHHYNAPGYTVGEVKRLSSPGRREIGHGYLAERAISPILPTESEFPYAIRSVTEIMSQNGSTSMAATCSCCMALMDAGVPIKAPVSGIAMGLIMDKNKVVVLSDIADAEDFAGDMDFKVTGTTEGITALQLDMKVPGLPVDILKQALEQSKKGRFFILQHMLKTIDRPRKELSPYAPRVESIKINPDKIREIIGKGGETIQKITAETGAIIDISNDGLITIASSDLKQIEAAKQYINSIVAEPEVGKVYKDVPVVSVLDFGAFVQILPGKDGLVHVSEMSDKRIENPRDFVKEGDRIDVKLISIDEKGRLQLSMKNHD